MHGNASRFFKPIKEAFDPMDRINAGKMHEIRTRFGFPGLRRVPLSMVALPLRALGGLKRLSPFRDSFAKKYEARGGRR